MNPFLVLNVPMTATDEEIREAYVAAVQASPPESDPERFQAVQEAWKVLATERSRWRWRMIDGDPPASSPLEAVALWCRQPGKLQPIGESAFRELLRYAAAPPEPPSGPKSKNIKRKRR